MAQNPCKYIIEIKPGEFKEMTEPELKDYLLNQDLSNLKTIQDAIQERSAEEKVSRPRGAGKNISESSEGVRSSQQRQKIAPKSRIEGYEEEKVNEFLYKGTPAERQRSLLKNLMSSDIPEEYKKGLEEQGLTYKVSNQVEANQAARAIVNDLGVADALDIARSEKVDPSVGSAIFAESLNDMWSKERKLRAEGKIEEADALARQWTATSKEYANLTTGKGQWNAQIAYFYKTSPMGFSIMVNEDRYQNFETSFYNPREANFKDVFKELLKGEEGQALIKEEANKLLKEERSAERKKRDKSIDDFFDKAKLKGGTYGTIIPPQVWNAAVEIMKASVKAGDRIVIAVQSAIDHIEKELKGEKWDKEKFRSEYEAQLEKVVGEGASKERDLIKSLERRTKELERRIKEKDFSAEEYKGKKTLNEKEQAAKSDYDRVKNMYDEAKKESPEYIDKKAKQYLEAFSKRLKGLSDEQKETIVRRSLKKIVESGGLEYDEFKDIIAEASGVKKLTEAEMKEIEALTAKSNIADDLEQEFLNNPTRESIDAFKKAKAESLEADRKLYELTTQKADVVGTLKSLITLNYLSLNTLVKNFAQNIIYQSTVRFPASLSVKGVDYTVYQVSNLANKIIGTKVIKPKVSLTDAQKGYFKEYREGVIRGWEQMIKGIDEKDYFSQSQYASTLNPRKAYRDLKKSMSGELFLSKQQKIDKWIQSTLGWQPYAISRGMIYGDKPPRYAAQGAEALQLGHQELGIKDPIEIEAFMTSPEKYAYNYLIKKAGLTSEEASKQSKSIAKRIVDAGSRATFQNENYLNDFLSKIDEWARVTEKDNAVGKIIKPPVAILKASTLPFVKTPANVAWVYFKVVNPELTMLKSMGEAAIAKRALSKGDLIGYREYSKKSKESFGFAVVGLVVTAGAAALVQKGLVRTKNTEEDEARERAGESFFGKDNQVNLGVLLGSGDDYWVDLSWFGPIGSMIDVRGRMMEDAKQKELKGEPVEASWLQDRLTTLGYSTTSILNTLVFDQGAKLVDALRKGPDMAGQLIVNNANALENMVFGGTLASMSRALTPEKVNNKADNIIDEIKNNTKQRNIFVAWATGYPPSKISIWGEPMPQDKSVSGVLGSMLGFEKGSNNKFGAILYDEQRRTGRNEFFPPVEDYRIKVNGKDVKISEAEKRDLDVFIGQARKVMVAPFIYNKSTYPKIQDGQLKEKTFLDLTNDKDDESKLAALAIIYKNAKEAGFAKFKDKYKQYQDASINIEQIKKEALKGAEKEVFKARFKTEPK
jgi:hypothetical protein